MTTLPYSPSALKILEAASSLFAKNGFRNTTTRDIAVTANVNQATIFRNFKNGKNEIAMAAVSHLGETAHYQERFNQAVQQCDPQDPKSIIALALLWVELLCHHREFCKIIWSALVEPAELGTVPVLRTFARSTYVAPMREFIKTFCSHAIGTGIMSGDPNFNADALFALMIFKAGADIMASETVFQTAISQESGETLAHSIVDLWLTGCAYKLPANWAELHSEDTQSPNPEPAAE